MELEAVAGRVEPPPGAEPVPPARRPEPLGRLAGLASWWERVAPRPGPPAAVRHLWPAGSDPPGDVDAAFGWGVAAADDAADGGADLLLVSVPAPGPAAVLGAHLLALDPVEAMGWPARAGLDDEAWTAAVVAVRDGLRAVRGLYGLPGVMLPKLASPAIAAGTGLLLQSAARRTPALLDGPGAAACALLAHRVTRHARGWWQAAHADGTVLHDRLLAELGLAPLLRLDLRAEDGTAPRLALHLLEAAAP